jgi:hypothetical protein
VHSSHALKHACARPLRDFLEILFRAFCLGFFKLELYLLFVHSCLPSWGKNLLY